MKKKIVLKIGTSTLTQGSNRISYGKLEDLARQIVTLKSKYDIIIVSSGAIAAAKQFIEIKDYNVTVESKQAMAAIGQPKLMKIYDEVFGSFGLSVAQCLMSYRDFENKSAQVNTNNTIDVLLQNNYIPIVNENDTVAIEEIVLGDNDKLSALVSVVVSADLLVIASDIDGLYDSNPHLNPDAKLITDVSNLETIMSYAQEKQSSLGTGGMSSKIQAATICKDNKIEMWIVNGGKKEFLVKALDAKISFTKFLLN